MKCRDYRRERTAAARFFRRRGAHPAVEPPCHGTGYVEVSGIVVVGGPGARFTRWSPPHPSPSLDIAEGCAPQPARAASPWWDSSTGTGAGSGDFEERNLARHAVLRGVVRPATTFGDLRNRALSNAWAGKSRARQSTARLTRGPCGHTARSTAPASPPMTSPLYAEAGEEARGGHRRAPLRACRSRHRRGTCPSSTPHRWSDAMKWRLMLAACGLRDLRHPVMVINLGALGLQGEVRERNIRPK